MLKSNLVTPPMHKGDSVAGPEWLSFLMRGLRHPIKAARHIIKHVSWKLTGVYHLASFLDGAPIHVVDVGAAGGFDKRWKRLGKNLRIFLFEPERASYNKIVDAFASDNRVKVFDCALSENGQPLDLHVTRWPRSSSVFQPSSEYVKASHIRDHYDVVEVVSLQSRRLIDVCTESGNLNIDFIKIDAEGYELPILKGGGVLLDSVIGLELEIYFQQVRLGQPLFSDMDAFCRHRGFDFMKFTYKGEAATMSHFLLPSCRLESEGFLCATDAIYFRSPKNIVSLVEARKWKVDKIYSAAALFLTYSQHEYAFILLSLAAEKHLIEPTDHRFGVAMKLIDNCSGYNKSFFYHKIFKMTSSL